MTEAVAVPAEQVPAQPAQATATAPVETAKPVEGQQPAEQSQGTEANPEQGNEKEGERQQSRAARRWNRMRDRAIAAETELRLLREQQGKAQPQQQAQQQQAPADDGSPKREAFGTYEEFIEAKATWKAEQAAEARARKIIEDSKKSDTERVQQESQAKQQQDWDKHVEAAREAIADFDDVCEDSEAPVTPAMQAAIREAGDKGPLIAYHLAKNEAEAKRIAGLSPTRQVAAIVALEEKITKPAKAPSKAPAPINPAGKGGDAEPVWDTTRPEAAAKLSTDKWIQLEKERMLKNAGARS